MIVLNLELDNLFGFEDFKINFSYPKKIVNSSIKDETLYGKPNFRYKKVNIIMGKNASGKTSLGKALMMIFNFFEKKESSNIVNKIKNKKKVASFSIDLVLGTEAIFQKPKPALYRVNCSFKARQDIQLDIFKTKILKMDSYESAVRRLEKVNLATENYIETLDYLENHFGWLFIYPEEGSNFLEGRNNIDLKIFENILKTLDPSILGISKIRGVKNSYKLELKNQDLIIQNGKFIDDSILSSGTKAGIHIAGAVNSIKENLNGFFYCDEKFSYIHSDIEKSILSLMINFLKPNTQLFFTTHNLEILDMDLPLHSFTFLRKKEKIEVVYTSDYIKKKDQSLKNAVKNDLFNVAPNLELIYELEEV